ncbi:MAG TPA: metalloregulator ArsR/SmtB family transcription factor [Oscillospiraceae bacterium]|nr:metalloregulator ArsR/SmtB family transcription factor [Oscillospiraceae bacterium]
MAELLEILKSLADETRYQLLKLLLQHDYCVGALAQKLNISESAVSQHLKILRQTGLIKGDKRGYYTHYYVERELLKQAAKDLNQLSHLVPCSTACHQTDKCSRNCEGRGKHEQA